MEQKNRKTARFGIRSELAKNTTIPLDRSSGRLWRGARSSVRPIPPSLVKQLLKLFGGAQLENTSLENIRLHEIGTLVIVSKIQRQPAEIECFTLRRREEIGSGEVALDVAHDGEKHFADDIAL